MGKSMNKGKIPSVDIQNLISSMDDRMKNEMLSVLIFNNNEWVDFNNRLFKEERRKV